jgi:lactoylglutathione lyase
MDLQPHHIGIVVSDLERSTDFYRALGFEVVKDLPSEDGSRTIRFVRLGAFELELFWYEAPAAPVVPPAGKGQLGFRHLALRTGDINAVLSSLKALGVAPAELEVRKMPIGYSIMFLSDPDGLEIEIMQED